MLVLPVVLTVLMLAWWRWRGRNSEPPKPMALLLLSAIGIATHPFLDWMNTYGMRWLMPIDPTWWYADTLFIVDPWIWAALGAGVWFSRRRERRGMPSMAPSSIAVAGVALYIAAMGALGVTARRGVREALAARGITADTVVLEPVVGNPVRRRVTWLWEGAYRIADYSVFPPALSEPWFTLPLNAEHPAAAAASRTPQGREYHSWTRLPYYVIEPGRDTTWVTIGDARYTLDGRSSWASVRIPVATALVPVQ